MKKKSLKYFLHHLAASRTITPNPTQRFPVLVNFLLQATHFALRRSQVIIQLFLALIINPISFVCHQYSFFIRRRKAIIRAFLEKKASHYFYRRGYRQDSITLPLSVSPSLRFDYIKFDLSQFFKLLAQHIAKLRLHQILIRNHGFVSTTQSLREVTRKKIVCNEHQI